MKKLTRKQKRILVAQLIRISVDSLFYIGIFTLWGSIGAIEVGRVDYHQFIVQCIIGIALCVFSKYARGILFESKDEEDYV